MEAMPTPKPTKILPIIITQGAGASAMVIAPIKKKKSAIIIDILLPTRSFSHPPIAAPAIAPATAMLTIVDYILYVQHISKLKTNKEREIYIRYN